MIHAPTIQQPSAYQQFTFPRSAGMMSLPSSVLSVSSARKSNFTQAILAEMQSRPNVFIPSMHQYNPQYNPSLIHRLRLEAMQGELASRSAPHPSQWLAAQQQSLIAARVDQQRGLFLQNLGSPQVAAKKNSPVAGLDLLQSTVLEATSVKAGTARPAKKKSNKKISTLSSYYGRTDIVDDPTDCDILCGRGGRSNHHPGNIRYRQVVGEMKASYKTIGTKAAKTGLSSAIVDHVYAYGGRFLKKIDKKSGKYQVLSVIEARKKTSQALREASMR